MEQNREIKFRGWATDRQKWVYGYLFKTPLTAENFEADSFQVGKVRWCISTEYGVVYEIDIASLGQITGMKDKNGAEIYEKDIVRTKHKGEISAWVVQWIENAGRFVFTKNINDKDALSIHVAAERERREKQVAIIEKIGNLFENPELLK